MGWSVEWRGPCSSRALLRDIQAGAGAPETGLGPCQTRADFSTQVWDSPVNGSVAVRFGGIAALLEPDPIRPQNVHSSSGWF